MAIALVGTPTIYGAIGTTSVINNVPTGTTTGHVLVWAFGGAVAGATATPSGWTLVQSGTTTACNITVFYRLATASEPASYTATVASGRWAGVMVSLSGVNTTTPIDVAAPAAAIGTTAMAFPAITPVTSQAWVFGFGSWTIGQVAGATISSTNLTMDATAQSGSTTTASNALVGDGHIVWSAGAFTPNMTSSQAATRTLGVTAAFRPAAGGAVAGRVRTMSRWR